MKHETFLIEIPSTISNFDLKNMRKLYLPIIGPNAAIVYEYLTDLAKINKLFNINDLCDHLQLSNVSLHLALDNLEAVGLITSFIHKDKASSILTLLKPNDIEAFEKNPLLKKHLIKIIGKAKFDNWYYDQKSKFVNKANYHNVSKKYQEVFSDVFEQMINEDDKTYTTLDLVVDLYDTHEENVEKLTASLFIKYMLKRNPTYYENQLINALLNLGFDDRSINLFIDFSMQFNGVINCPYLSKIGQDFRKRGINSYDDVRHELQIVADYKNGYRNKVKPKSSLFKNESEEMYDTYDNKFVSTLEDIDPRDLFKDDDEEEEAIN